MDVQAAARLGDEIAHGFGVAAMLCGAVAGAVIGAIVVAATVATGGIAIVLIGGAIAAGGLSMFQVAKGLSKLFDLPEPTTGVLTNGSPDVYINGRNAMRAGEDGAGSCSGLPLNHPMWPFAVHIAEGSATVYINGKPAARLNSKMVCGAHIKSGSPDTFIGGPTASIAFVLDIESWMHTGLEALGLAAMGSALVLAAMAGAAMLAIAVVVGATTMAGMALLGDLGDRLGPGGRDLLQGIAGMALLGFAPKVRTFVKPPPSSPPSLVDELTANGVKFTRENLVAVVRDPTGRIIFLETGDSQSGLQHIVARHKTEFAQRDVSEAEIPKVLMDAIMEGNIVGYQGKGTGRPIFETVINGTPQRLAISIGSNGYIVGVNPKGRKK
jgi:uncharacterized Zn-binding protein involved in type VI secretion